MGKMSKVNLTNNNYRLKHILKVKLRKKMHLTLTLVSNTYIRDDIYSTKEMQN